MYKVVGLVFAIITVLIANVVFDYTGSIKETVIILIPIWILALIIDIVGRKNKKKKK